MRRSVYGEVREVRGPVIQNETGRLVDEQPETAWRRLPLPLPALTLATGAKGTVTVAPQSIFKVVKINIPSPGVAGVFLTDVKVGQASQFIAGGDIDVRCLIPEAVSTYMDFDTGKVGNVFAMTFENTSAGEVTLAPMAICEVLRPGNSV